MQKQCYEFCGHMQIEITRANWTAVRDSGDHRHLRLAVDWVPWRHVCHSTYTDI